MQALDEHYRLRERQANADLCNVPLWPFHRVTGWRIIKQVMQEAGLHGPVSMPKAFRHGFGTGTLRAGLPVTLLQRWLGHSRLSTTAIYLDVAGPEEFAPAQRYWVWSLATNSKL